MPLPEAFGIALVAAIGIVLLAWAMARWQRRRFVRGRVVALGEEWSAEERRPPPEVAGPGGARLLVSRIGAGVAPHVPREIGALATRVDKAGLTGGVDTLELLGWKLMGACFGLAVGMWFVARLGPPGLILLGACVLIGWFGIDFMLSRYHTQRRRAILRDLPTIMDLLVLSLEAGMSLDRALRTVIHEYHSAFSFEVARVLRDVDLGMGRGAAFERMAERVGLEDLRRLSRAIVQSEQLGVSLVTVMRTQSHEVRLSRRRAAEAEALRAPVKMLIPLVIFILPTLFMLLLGPVGLRAAAALSGAALP